jgi:hypothetical protein
VLGLGDEVSIMLTHELLPSVNHTHTHTQAVHDTYAYIHTHTQTHKHARARARAKTHTGEHQAVEGRQPCLPF